MILQALTEYYETLAAKGKIAALGWGPAKVSFALYIRADGALERVVDVREGQQRGKKTVLAPQELIVPAPVKRSSGVAANFLCDSSSYLLGFDDKGKPQRALECFAAAKKLHEELLAGVDAPAAQAVLAFFASWQPEQAREHPLLAEYLEDILAGGNLVFRFGGYVHDDPAVRQAWNRHYSSDGEGPEMICLVTGERGPVELTHPSIKNVAGAQSSGASLVSFNAPAFCSYGKEQNLNAPTGKYAAFAYTSALNHLLKDRERVFRVGDTTVVCWAKGGGNAYQNLFGCAFFGNRLPDYTSADLTKAVKDLCRGKMVEFDETRLDPNMDFCILGLAPNAARLSVRFFLRNSFGNFLKNAESHQKRLEIVRPSYDPFEELSIWRLLDETVNQNSRDKSPVPNLAGETLRSVLTNTPYPAQLLNGVQLRILADREITRGRAAIIKAYYLKNTHPNVPKEVLTVSLNSESSYASYVLGRLFSVLEAIQTEANPGINTTIKDKFFSSASATPAHIFPVLLDLAQKHLRKIDPRRRVYYDKQMTEFIGKLGGEFPATMNIPMKGSFQLGYYHQTQKRYEKKEDK